MDTVTAAHRLVCTKDQAIPWLIAARHGGHLVPFVGAGMSRPFCTGWINFIRELCSGFGHEIATLGLTDTIDTERLYRVADRVASWLRLLPPEERRQRLVAALRPNSGGRDGGLPPQLRALATVSWPLVVTTNYDDLLLAAVAAENQERSGNPGKLDPLVMPLVLGRSPRDCTEVVRSLDSLRPPIVWHVQGHIPGVASHTAGEQANSEIDALLDQVVLGHQQYQQAINAEPAFRRAFAEVFRRRSLLFLGSGLAESYVVNLISEALFGFGPSTRSHYALFARDELRQIDTEFLAMRLGITPIAYGESHDDLPAVIRYIAQASDKSTTSLTGLTFKVKPTFRVAQVV